MYGTKFGKDINSNFIFDFFNMLTYNMSIFAKDSKSDEEIFEFLKTKLSSTDPDINRLIIKW